jgi:hypothetical protein
VKAGSRLREAACFLLFPEGTTLAEASDMHVPSSILFVAASFAIVWFGTGCGDPVNCGQEGEATGQRPVVSATVAGTLSYNPTVGAPAQYPASTPTSASTSGCFASVSGAPTAPSLTVTCPPDDLSLTFTLPDLRTLTDGQTAAVPTALSMTVGGAGCEIAVLSGATLTTTTATGAASAGPTFVSADFALGATITLDVSGASVAGIWDKEPGCRAVPFTSFSLSAQLSQTASNYTEQSVCVAAQ